MEKCNRGKETSICSVFPEKKQYLCKPRKYKSNKSPKHMEVDCNMNLVSNESNNLQISKEQTLKTLVPRMEKLNLSSESLCESPDAELCESSKLAGRIHNAIRAMNLVVVEPAAGSDFLAPGTVLFIRQSNPSDVDFPSDSHLEFGCVDDVFGSINAPLYSIELSQRAPEEIWSFLRQGVHVFYIEDHPMTMYLRVGRGEDGFKIITSKRKSESE